jgi:uncharacterized membrane protein (DUF373 family)
MSDVKIPAMSLLPIRRNHVVRALETIQDLIVVSLCMGLFCFMVLQLRSMFISLLPPLDFREVTSDILFLLILVELFRLLIIYLQEQRVSIGVAVEVAIVSVLREVIVRGLLEVPWTQVLSACAFLMVMGALLLIRVWLPPTFSGVDPERRIAQSHRYQAQPDATSATSGHAEGKGEQWLNYPEALKDHPNPTLNHQKS